jgi:hypothetical protein
MHGCHERAEELRNDQTDHFTYHIQNFLQLLYVCRQQEIENNGTHLPSQLALALRRPSSLTAPSAEPSRAYLPDQLLLTAVTAASAMAVELLSGWPYSQLHSSTCTQKPQVAC